MSRLDEIREREKAATLGPWKPDSRTGFIAVWAGPGVQIANTSPKRNYSQGSHSCGANTEFIAHARQDIPHLLAEVERLRSVVLKNHSWHLEHDDYGGYLGSEIYVDNWDVLSDSAPDGAT